MILKETAGKTPAAFIAPNLSPVFLINFFNAHRRGSLQRPFKSAQISRASSLFTVPAVIPSIVCAFLMARNARHPLKIYFFTVILGQENHWQSTFYLITENLIAMLGIFICLLTCIKFTMKSSCFPCFVAHLQPIFYKVIPRCVAMHSNSFKS